MLPPSIRRLFRLALPRQPLAREIDAELKDHLHRRAEDLVASGWSPAEAEAEALRRFGPVAPVAAACQTIDQQREDRMIRREWWADLGQDLHYALRGLRRNPSATTVAALTFALGIGVNAAVFSLVDAVVLKPLPYAHAGRLVRIYERDATRETGQVTIGDFRDWRDQSRAFDGLAAFRFSAGVLNTASDNRQLPAAQVTANFFDLLGVVPAQGRGFVEGEDLPGSPRVVVVSHGLWQAHLGGDSRLVGGEIQLNGAPVTVVGVLPEDFVPPLGSGTDIWTPNDFESIAGDASRNRRMHFLASFGRLRPGATLAEGVAELEAIGGRLELAYPNNNTGHRPNPVPLSLAGIQSTRPALLLTMGAVALVLLVACANLANLIFARALGRTQEFTVRAALGADRRRLVRQVLTEQGLLALIGGAIGMAAAALAIGGLAQWLAPILPRAARVGMDGRVILFALVVSLVAAILSGLLPALLAGRAGQQPSGRGESRGGTTTVGGRRLRTALVAAQVALAVVLLAGAGLVVRSLTRLMALDLGFQTEQVLTFSVPLPAARFADRAAMGAFQLRFVDAIQSLPGVVAAGVAYAIPMQNASTTSFDIPERPFPENDLPEVGYNAASSGYFQALGIPLLSGRLMDETRDHDGAPEVVVINQSMARQFWPGDNPVGRFIRSGLGGADAPLQEIIGVVGDIRRASVERDAVPEMYYATTQDISPNPSFTVRATGDPVTLMAGLRARLRELDPTLPLANVTALRDVVNNTLFRPRFLATLFSFFAVLALLLAGVGIYGVIAFLVAEQSREIGIRRALGATGGEIRRRVIRQGMLPVAAGLVIGLGLAVGLSGAMRSMLYGVAPTDPATLASVVVVTLLAGLIGCLAPAMRATRIEPVTALREG
jgi:predicted permease